MTDTTDTNQSHRLIASDRVEGTAVNIRTGEKLGSVKNFMVGKLTGQVEYAVLQFGGLFGLGSDYYPLPWNMLDYNPAKGGYVIDLDKPQLENAPSHGEKFPEYDHNYGRRIFDYYGMAYPYI